MKNFTKQDYEKEIIRFCQILTQQKYDKRDDKIIKKMILQNLDHVSFDASLQDSDKVSKKAQKNRIFQLCSALVKMEFGTKEDKETKRDIAKALGILSRCVENARQSRLETIAENKLKRMVACF